MKAYAADLNFGAAAVDAGLSGSGTDAGGLISSLMSGVMTIAALLLLMYLLWGGIEWITSGGDTSKVQKARDRMTQAVIGMVVISSATAIFLLVQTFLGIEILTFN
jgi:hypothetical protein